MECKMLELLKKVRAIALICLITIYCIFGYTIFVIISDGIYRTDVLILRLINALLVLILYIIIIHVVGLFEKHLRDHKV